MILFISDLHLGREERAVDRANEAAAIHCVRAHREDLEHLVLVGDVFDEYIEYRHLVPKGYVRFLALLAELTDAGVPVTYLYGNHDPWHIDYFTEELGVRLVPDRLLEPLHGRNVYIEHGDACAPGSGLRRWIRPLLRHPWPTWLYRTLLPGDSGFGLARWVNRSIRDDRLQPEAIERLRRHARDVLQKTDADVVIMGHTHHPELHTWPEGQYLNTGCWYAQRTFARLDGGMLSLVRWDDAAGKAVPADDA